MSQRIVYLKDLWNVEVIFLRNPLLPRRAKFLSRRNDEPGRLFNRLADASKAQSARRLHMTWRSHNARGSSLSDGDPAVGRHSNPSLHD